LKATPTTSDLYNFVIAGVLSISRSGVKKHNVHENSQQCDKEETIKCFHALSFQIAAKVILGQPSGSQLASGQEDNHRFKGSRQASNFCTGHTTRPAL